MNKWHKQLCDCDGAYNWIFLCKLLETVWQTVWQEFGCWIVKIWQFDKFDHLCMRVWSVWPPKVHFRSIARLFDFYLNAIYLTFKSNFRVANIILVPWDLVLLEINWDLIDLELKSGKLHKLSITRCFWNCQEVFDQCREYFEPKITLKTQNTLGTTQNTLAMKCLWIYNTLQNELYLDLIIHGRSIKFKSLFTFCSILLVF